MTSGYSPKARLRVTRLRSQFAISSFAMSKPPSLPTQSGIQKESHVDDVAGELVAMQCGVSRRAAGLHFRQKNSFDNEGI